MGLPTVKAAEATASFLEMIRFSIFLYFVCLSGMLDVSPSDNLQAATEAAKTEQVHFTSLLTAPLRGSPTSRTSSTTQDCLPLIYNPWHRTSSALEEGHSTITPIYCV
jgi:hypothetical protein